MRSHPRTRLQARGSALALLLLQLLLGALPHSDRLGDGEHRIGATADQASVRHAAGCQACLIGHAPGSPGTLPTLAVPATVAEVSEPPAPSAAHSTSLTLHNSRAPPTALL